MNIKISQGPCKAELEGVGLKLVNECYTGNSPIRMGYIQGYTVTTKDNIEKRGIKQTA